MDGFVEILPHDLMGCVVRVSDAARKLILDCNTLIEVAEWPGWIISILGFEDIKLNASFVQPWGCASLKTTQLKAGVAQGFAETKSGRLAHPSRRIALHANMNLTSKEGTGSDDNLSSRQDFSGLQPDSSNPLSGRTAGALVRRQDNIGYARQYDR
jgi:hypothetical protein